MNILKQVYTAYFSKNTSEFLLKTRIFYENENDTLGVDKEIFDFFENVYGLEKIDYYIKNFKLNYLYFLGDLLECNNPFDFFKTSFSDTGEISSQFFEFQLLQAKNDYDEYIKYNNFSLDFFDRFVNSKNISVNRKLVEIVNDCYVPLRIDSDMKNVYYSYQSENIKDIIFATVHFALENGYKFVKCKHCERWFFTPTKKEVFCKRISPCFNMIVNDKKVLGMKQPCRIAVDTIKKRLRDRKKTIYNKWKNCSENCPLFDDCFNCPYKECVYEKSCELLCNNHNKYMGDIMKNPTVENILKYHSYLYSDDMPKQERPNRRKKDGANNG